MTDNSLKQQSANRHVSPLGHIILIPSQPVFALSTKCGVLSEEATKTNFIVFGLTRPALEPTIYRTRGEHTNHYATDEVGQRIKDKKTLLRKLKLVLITFFGASRVLSIMLNTNADFPNQRKCILIKQESGYNTINISGVQDQLVINACGYNNKLLHNSRILTWI